MGNLEENYTKYESSLPFMGYLHVAVPGRKQTLVPDSQNSTLYKTSFQGLRQPKSTSSSPSDKVSLSLLLVLRNNVSQ